MALTTALMKLNQRQPIAELQLLAANNGHLTNSNFAPFAYLFIY